MMNMEKSNETRTGKGEAPLKPERRPHTFPPYVKGKGVRASIARRQGESKREAPGIPYYAGGPRINPELLRRLDVLSRAHHQATDLLSRGIYSYFIQQVELDILHDRGGIFDDR